jgi:hypothetical protein
MTSTPIDNAITNTVLPNQSQGQAVPDSIPTLADTPQLVMTPGAVRPNYLFADGGGVSGVIGNSYVGYGSGLGGTSIIVNDGSNGGDQFEGGDTDDETFWKYSLAENIWQKVSYLTGKLMKLDSETVAPADGELAVYDLTNDVWIPQPSEDIFSVYVPAPTNETIALAPTGMPYDIEIVSGSDSFGTGSGTVTLPTPGTVITAGTTINALVSGLSGDAAELSIQLNFKRRLAP